MMRSKFHGALLVEEPDIRRFAGEPVAMNSMMSREFVPDIVWTVVATSGSVTAKPAVPEVCVRTNAYRPPAMWLAAVTVVFAWTTARTERPDRNLRKPSY